MKRVHVVTVALVVALVSAEAATRLPTKLSDADFWALSARLSEPSGSFRSENFVSNEREFQSVIPALVAQAPQTDIYIGVGPEQNFSYIAALEPRLAFIVDIRRGNLLEHLLYKALFELSRDRAEFLSRLFSRARSPMLSKRSTVAELFAAYQRAEPTAQLYDRNVKAVIENLTVDHHFRLAEEDVVAIRNIYRYGFFTAGPNLTYAAGGGDGGGLAPTYQELMSADDGRGVKRSYLATEQNFAAVRRLQMKNLIVPVVGDFAGPTAIRGIGEYARQHGAAVSSFYLSNVEDYLIQEGRWGDFCGNVRTVPFTATGTFIFTGSGAPKDVRPNSGGLETHLRPVQPDIERCSESAIVR